jgi:hypothetical protein
MNPKAKAARSDARWIGSVLDKSKRGTLHKNLGVPLGKKIPVAKLNAAAKEPGKIGARARLALTLRSFAKK